MKRRYTVWVEVVTNFNNGRSTTKTTQYGPTGHKKMMTYLAKVAEDVTPTRSKKADFDKEAWAARMDK